MNKKMIGLVMLSLVIPNLVFAYDDIKENIVVNNDGVIGYFLDNKELNVTGDINVSGNLSRGIVVTSGTGSADIKGNIIVSGNSSVGISTNYSQHTDMGNFHIYGNVISSGYNSTGGSFLNDNVIIDGNVISEKGANNGLFLRGNDTCSVIIKGSVLASDSHQGITTQGNKLFIGGNVVASGYTTNGIYAMDDSVVTVKGKVIASGEKSKGIYAVGGNATVYGNVEVAGNNAVGLEVVDTSYFQGGTVNFNGDKITVSGNSARGLDVSYYGVANINGNIEVTGNGASAIYMRGYEGVVNMNITGDRNGERKYIQVADTGNYLTSAFSFGENTTGKFSSIVNIENVDVKVDGAGYLLIASGIGVLNAENSTLTGNLWNYGNGTANKMNVNLKGGSVFTGFITSNYVSAGFNLTLDSKKDIWNVTANSVPFGTLVNRGIINFADTSLNNDFKLVAVGNYTGDNGMIILRADIDADKNDQFIINSKSAGNTNIFVKSTAAANGMTESMNNALIRDVYRTYYGGDGTFSLANTGGYVESGGYKYVLQNKDITNDYGMERQWYLAKECFAPSTEKLALGSVIIPEIWYLEKDTLFKRSEIYSNPDYQGGFWMASGAKKIEHYNSDAFGSFDQNIWTMSLGWDKKSKRKNGTWFNGIILGYGKDDSRAKDGASNFDMNSSHLSVYTIQQKENGAYLGGIIKYNHYSSDISARINDSNERVTGHLNQDGFGGSITGGKRFQRGNGWYIDPVVEVAYLSIGGSEYTSSNGLKIKTNNAESLRTRGGIAFGRKRTFSNGSSLDVFVDASILREFKNKTNVVIEDDTTLVRDCSGTWGLYGFGVDWQMGNGRYLNTKIYYADGNSRKEPWYVQLSAGFKF